MIEVDNHRKEIPLSTSTNLAAMRNICIRNAMLSNLTMTTVMLTYVPRTNVMAF